MIVIVISSQTFVWSSSRQTSGLETGVVRRGDIYTVITLYANGSELRPHFKAACLTVQYKCSGQYFAPSGQLIVKSVKVVFIKFQPKSDNSLLPASCKCWRFDAKKCKSGKTGLRDILLGWHFITLLLWTADFVKGKNVWELKRCLG